MRIVPLLITGIIIGVSGAAQASETAELSGIPALLPSGLIMVEGRDVALWGIDPLANDQECWHDNRAWDCGEQALIALRHHLSGDRLRCSIKSEAGDGKASAQCFREARGREDDIAAYLVSQGWARDREADSGGYYADEEDDARRNRRGIWTSRFQSAEDWKNGIQNFIEYEPVPPKPASSAVPSRHSTGIMGFNPQ